MVSEQERATPALDERYGRSPGSRKREKRLAIIVASAFAIVLIAWVTWASIDAAGPSIDVRDTAHSIIDEHTVDVVFELSVETGTATYCAVQALNDRFAVVGWKVIEVPAGDKRTRTFTERLITTEKASTGLIYRCWLA